MSYFLISYDVSIFKNEKKSIFLSSLQQNIAFSTHHDGKVTKSSAISSHLTSCAEYKQQNHTPIANFHTIFIILLYRSLVFHKKNRNIFLLIFLKIQYHDTALIYYPVSIATLTVNKIIKCH